MNKYLILNLYLLLFILYLLILTIKVLKGDRVHSFTITDTNMEGESC